MSSPASNVSGGTGYNGKSVERLDGATAGVDGYVGSIGLGGGSLSISRLRERPRHSSVDSSSESLSS